MVKRQADIKRKYLSKPYPENLILTLMRGHVDSVEITSDVQAGLAYVLTTLTEIEQEVLKYRFQMHMTYKEIGMVRGCTGNSARGSENNAMRKLRHSSRIGYILYGREGFEAMNCVIGFPGEAAVSMFHEIEDEHI